MRKNALSKSVLVSGLLFATTVSAQPFSTNLQLVPMTPGPYEVGDTVQLLVQFHQNGGSEVLLTNLTLNFSNTPDSAVELLSYEWSWSNQRLCSEFEVQCGVGHHQDAELPIVSVDYWEGVISPVCQLHIEGDGDLYAGILTVKILSGAATNGAWIDALALSAGASSTSMLAGHPPAFYSSASGDIEGSPLILVEGPNMSVPAASNIGLTIMVVAILWINRYLRKQRAAEAAA